jgi:hypothetical protein
VVCIDAITKLLNRTPCFSAEDLAPCWRPVSTPRSPRKPTLTSFHHTTLPAIQPPARFPQRYPSNSMLTPSNH